MIDFRLECFCFLMSCLSKTVHTFSVTDLTGRTSCDNLKWLLPYCGEINK